MNSTPNYGFDKTVNICALDAVDRELKRLDDKIGCCKPDAYTKCEIYQLLEGKVDKKDSCRLICEDELQGIYAQLGERYTKEKVYTQAEVDALLAKKANKGVLNEYDLSVANGLESSAKFSINENKQVFIYGAISSYTLIPYGEVVAVLPEGFRSKTRWEFPVTGFKTNQRSGYAGTVVVTPDGNIEARVPDEINMLYFNFLYQA